jgi:hypothetical protein
MGGGVVIKISLQMYSTLSELPVLAFFIRSSSDKHTNRDNGILLI